MGVRIVLPESCKRRDRRSEETQIYQPATEPQESPEFGSGQVLKTRRRQSRELIELWMATEELRHNALNVIIWFITENVCQPVADVSYPHILTPSIHSHPSAQGTAILKHG